MSRADNKVYYDYETKSHYLIHCFLFTTRVWHARLHCSAWLRNAHSVRSMKIERQQVVTILILLVILFVAGLATFFFVRSGEPVKKDAPIRKALEITTDAKSYTDVTGKDVTLTDHYGKTIVVYSWASWCPQCHQGLIDLNKFAADKNDETVSFLMVNRAENTLVTNRFLETLPKLSNLEIVIDPSDHFFTSIDGYTVPEVIVYNRSGEVILRQQGQLQLDELSRVLEEES